MLRKSLTARKNAVVAVAVLALGIAGVALAGMTAGTNAHATSTIINVTVLDGKVQSAPTLRLSATSLPAGKVTLVVVNKGKTSHALAIMGNGLAPKRTPTLAAGKTARLIVTLAAGMYHVWDPVRSSMSRAKYLTVKKATTSGAGSGSGSYGSSGSGSSGGTTTTTHDDGMEGCDH